MTKDGLDLGCKNQLLIVHIIVKRLFADAITNKNQSALWLIPQSDCKHSSKPIDKRLRIRFIKMNDCLGIATSPEDVRMLQLTIQITVVVDFSVETNPDCPILI